MKYRNVSNATGEVYGEEFEIDTRGEPIELSRLRRISARKALETLRVEKWFDAYVTQALVGDRWVTVIA
ncbi:hypothetical protein [Glutamicibacter sp. X7]